MRTWKEVIKEATAAEIRRAGEAVLRAEREKNKAEKITKGKSAYQKYLDDQLAFKKEKYEAQKAAQLKRIRQGKVQKPLEAAKQSLANIKTTPISSKSGDGTAYSDLIGNVGSAVGGVSGAAFHGIRALAAKRKADKEAKAAKEKEKQQEKRERKTTGRPLKNPPGGGGGSGGPTQPGGPPPAEKRSSRSVITGLLRKSNSPPRKQYIGNTANIKEKHSNWREELLIEVDEKDKGKKEKIINVMKGKNTIIINPDEKKVNEALDEWHPDPEKDRRLGGPGPNQRAREDRPSSKKLKPGESYYEYAKRQRLKEEGPVLSVGRGEKLPVSQGAGLTAKGRARYNRETGSNLQAPVTGDVKPGSKSAQRRKNFCSRSRSWKGERGLAARRRWKC